MPGQNIYVSENATTVLVLPLLLMGLVGGVYGGLKHSDNRGTLVNNQSQPSEVQYQFWVRMFHLGFSYGGAELVPIRRDVDPVIQSVWPQFRCNILKPLLRCSVLSMVSSCCWITSCFSQSSHSLTSEDKQQVKLWGYPQTDTSCNW